MNVKRLFYSRYSAIVISCLFGIGLISFLFACTHDSCKYNYVGVDSNDLKKIFRKHDNCIQYIPKQTTCSQTKAKVDFN